MRSVRLLAVFLIIALTAVACSDSAAEPETPFFELIDPARASEIIDDGPDDLVVLDIRTPEEFAQARLAGAINIDYYAADFQAKLRELDPEKTYVVYCRTGNRSGSAMPVLQDLGFQRLYEIDGGIARWYEDGLPLG